MDRYHSEGSSSAIPQAKKHLVANPVAPGSSGEGLPYAPEDLPLVGDKWRWKVGKRISVHGYFIDRYLIPPTRYNKSKAPGNKGLTSRLLTERFIRKENPDADVDAFFASFLWKIPSRSAKCINDTERKTSSIAISTLHLNGHPEPMPTLMVGNCKAGNEMCSSRVEGRTERFSPMNCEICCTESGFCRDCCCILCTQSLDWSYGGYSLIRCEATVDDSSICGHVAHVDCALRSCMAGTVGGSIGLDVEYYCRRCDNKTDLISHVTGLLNYSKFDDSQNNIEKILNLCLCILRGSEKTEAKELRSRIELIMVKLRNGVNLRKLEDDTRAVTKGYSYLGSDMIMLGVHNGTDCQKSHDCCEIEPSHQNGCVDLSTGQTVYITSDHSNASLKLENDIDQVLQKLKEVQELEYRLAEEKLYAQRDFLLSLYQQLDIERSELESPSKLSNGGEPDSLLANVLSRVDQIKQEEAKFSEMMQISKGFGQTPKDILNQHFRPEDIN